LWVEIGQGLHFLWSEPRLRILAFISASTGILSSPADLAIIVLAQQQLHADAWLIGIILSISSIGGLIGSFVAPLIRAHLKFGQIIIGAIAAEALGCVILALAGIPIMLITGLATIAVAIPVIRVAQVSYRLSLVPDELQGRVNSVFRLLFFGGQPVGIALGGLLMVPLGPRLEYWLIAIGLGASAIIVSFSAIRKD
jgi:MFS family permease